MMMTFESAYSYVKSVTGPYFSHTNAPVSENNTKSKEAISGNILLVSPHPDDETINGLLPLRLLQETSAKIFNFPFTLGSNIERQQTRKKELEAATLQIGFKNIWDTSLNKVFTELKPKLIICPHAHDKHPTHEKTNQAVMAEVRNSNYSGTLIFWEFWQPNPEANLIVEADISLAAHLVSALSCHEGEVRRNPYHLRLPYWMMDNSRRGGEIILGNKAPISKLAMSALYQVQTYKNGKFSGTFTPKLLSLEESTGTLLNLPA